MSREKVGSPKMSFVNKKPIEMIEKKIQRVGVVGSVKAREIALKAFQFMPKSGLI